MNEELKKDVVAMVTEIFSQKEEAEQRAETEKALQKSAETVASLTEALEGKNAEAEETARQIEDMQSKIDELTSELEAAKTEATEKAEKLSEAENTIEEMKKDKAAELRMAELADKGVALTDKDAQMAKVREMEDEEFATYSEELVSLRSAVEAELARAEERASEEETQEEEETAGTETPEEEEAATEEDETAGEEEASEEDEETPPAEINPANTMAAALNMEVQPSDNLLAKYAKLGEAMAASMKKDD